MNFACGEGSAVNVTLSPGPKTGGSTVKCATGPEGAGNLGGAAPPAVINCSSASLVARFWSYFTLSKVTSVTLPVMVEVASGGWSRAQMFLKRMP